MRPRSKIHALFTVTGATVYTRARARARRIHPLRSLTRPTRIAVYLDASYPSRSRKPGHPRKNYVTVNLLKKFHNKIYLEILSSIMGCTNIYLQNPRSLLLSQRKLNDAHRSLAENNQTKEKRATSDSRLQRVKGPFFTFGCVR